jgi:hypothetical protein
MIHWNLPTVKLKTVRLWWIPKLRWKQAKQLRKLLTLDFNIRPWPAGGSRPQRMLWHARKKDQSDSCVRKEIHNSFDVHINEQENSDICIHLWYYEQNKCNKFYQYHRIGLWENLQESPIFDGKNHGFL